MNRWRHDVQQVAGSAQCLLQLCDGGRPAETLVSSKEAVLLLLVNVEKVLRGEQSFTLNIFDRMWRNRSNYSYFYILGHLSDAFIQSDSQFFIHSFTDGGGCQVRSSLGFSILPKDTSTCRSGELNQRPSLARRWIYLWGSSLWCGLSTVETSDHFVVERRCISFDSGGTRTHNLWITSPN